MFYNWRALHWSAQEISTGACGISFGCPSWVSGVDLWPLWSKRDKKIIYSEYVVRNGRGWWITQRFPIICLIVSAFYLSCLMKTNFVLRVSFFPYIVVVSLKDFSHNSIKYSVSNWPPPFCRIWSNNRFGKFPQNWETLSQGLRCGTIIFPQIH